jgi:hypothetical protein
MPAPRKPSNVLELKGAFKKDPSRRRKTLKVPDGPFGDPPDGFDEHQRRAWAEFLEIAPPGVLKPSDRLALELAASLTAEFRQASYAFNAAKIGQLRALLASFGMTPASREGFGLVNLADNKAGGRFSEFT